MMRSEMDLTLGQTIPLYIILSLNTPISSVVPVIDV